MHIIQVSAAIAALVAVLGVVGSAGAETASEIPKNAYYDDTLTASERSGIAEEENVSADDGQASVPPAADDGIIPDATIDQSLKANHLAAKETARASENEAEVVIEDSKKNDKVTASDMANCIKNWDPQTQMTKSEWEKSCRTTLEYFPEGP